VELTVITYEVRLFDICNVRSKKVSVTEIDVGNSCGTGYNP
jgi:hypothetical protein